MTRRNKGILVMASGLLALLWMQLLTAAPLDDTVLIEAASSKQVSIPLYKSGIVRIDGAAKRISVGNPGIADILILRTEQLYVVGKALGTTNVVVWDRSDRVLSSINLEITHDLGTLKRKFHDLLPGENIQVASAQEQIILSGQVSSASKMSAALKLAEGFLPECINPESKVTVKDASQAIPSQTTQGGESGEAQACKDGEVVNLMQVGGSQQVMMELKVAEISRTVLKRLDSDLNIIHFDKPWKFGAVQGGANFPNALTPEDLEVPLFGDFSTAHSPIGPSISKFDPASGTIDDSGLFMSWLSSKYFLEAVIEVSRQKGLAKILAEPTLTALTGEKAEFLSGGEFPIPVPQGGASNAVTIEFKEFGVGVNFLPVVLDSGHINLKLNVAVSEISQDNSVALGVQNTINSFVIPSLTKRSAGTTVELADGQTIGIAGLISDNLREFVNKLPGLGDVPILGTLFRSQEFRSGQTELVIFVTPHLARPISPQEVRLPTDSFVPPSDLEFYLLGKLEGRAPAEESTSVEIEQPEQEKIGALFGHEL